MFIPLYLQECFKEPGWTNTHQIDFDFFFINTVHVFLLVKDLIFSP